MISTDHYTAPPAKYDGENAEADLSLLRMTNIILRGRWLVVGVSIATAVLVAAVTLLTAKTYTTTIAFTPAAGSATTGSAVAGIAAQFGISVASGGTGTDTPDFFASLTTQPAFLLPIAQRHYKVAIDSVVHDTTYAGLYGKIADTEGETLSNAIGLLQDQVQPTTNSVTGVVTVAVTTKWRDLSMEVGTQILENLDGFAARLRNERAESERRFFQVRLDSTKAELTQAEGKVQRFLQANRAFTTDPQLQFEHDRLERELTLQQTVYTTLAQGFEQARLEAARNTPTLTVVQPAMPALIADKKQLILKVAAGIALGMVAGITFLFLREFTARGRLASPGEHEEFIRLRASLAQDFRLFARRVRHPFRRRPTA